jgi:hypothetical protein
MSKRRYKVRYARLVTMETEVVATPSKHDPDEPAKFLDDGRLPDVFHGVPTSKVGSHIKDVQDYDPIWIVTPVGKEATVA